MTKRLGWQALAAALALAAAVCLVMWGATSDQASTAASDDPATSASATAAPAAARPAPVSPTPETSPARPVALTIPRIGVRTDLVELGLQPDGSVEVPGDPARAGWFRLGPPPGAPGSSVILGHVDSDSGPAVFYRLAELRTGDRIVVRLDDGTTARFTVHSVQTYPNADFPAHKVYGRQGRSQVNLVTCGGAYDAARGGYQANVVVNARLAT